MAYEKPIHKVKKDETLIGIAKKYKHKDWKVIWKAAENKNLVAKRKKPEQIQPGDVLIIPLTGAQWKEIGQEIQHWQLNLSADTNFLTMLEKRRLASEKVIKQLTRTSVLSDKMHKSLVVDLQKTAAGAKKWGKTVDAIAAVTQLMISLGKLVKVGHAAAKATGKELAKLNIQMAKDTLDMAYDPIAKEARKAAAKHVQNEKKGYSTAMAALGIVSDSFDKMTSPSFWAWTVVRLKEGDSWSDAVTYDFQKEVKKKIAKMIQAHQKSQNEIKKSITEQETLIGSMSKERNNALSRIDYAKKQLKELEKLY